MYHIPRWDTVPAKPQGQHHLLSLTSEAVASWLKHVQLEGFLIKMLILGSV